MTEFFTQYHDIIIFLHVISAVIWVGGMIATRFATHYALAELEPPQRLERTAKVLKNLFKIVLPFAFISLATALIMAIAMGLHHGELKTVTLTKEIIWSIMTINLIAMMIRRSKAEKALLTGDLVAAKPLLGMIGQYMVPLNIILGLTVIYLGVTLS